MEKHGKILLVIVPFLVMFFAITGGGIGNTVWMGMKVDDLGKTKAERMGIPANAGQVVVVAVKDPARASGVITGDIVVGINGRKIKSRKEFMQAAQSVMNSRGQDGRLPDVVLTLNRLGNPLIITVPSEWVEASMRRL